MKDKNKQFYLDDRPLNMLSEKELVEFKIKHGITDESLESAKKEIAELRNKNNLLKNDHMTYKVLDSFKIGANTSVTIDGNGSNLQVGMTIIDSKGNEFKILSFAMDAGKSSFENTKSTILLVKGEFTDSKFIIFK